MNYRIIIPLLSVLLVTLLVSYISISASVANTDMHYANAIESSDQQGILRKIKTRSQSQKNSSNPEKRPNEVTANEAAKRTIITPQVAASISCNTQKKVEYSRMYEAKMNSAYEEYESAYNTLVAAFRYKLVNFNLSQRDRVITEGIYTQKIDNLTLDFENELVKLKEDYQQKIKSINCL